MNKIISSRSSNVKPLLNIKYTSSSYDLKNENFNKKFEGFERELEILLEELKEVD
jgi:hypothetical protein